MGDLQHFMGAATLLTELILLCLQVWAFRRFRHFSFLLLTISTIAGLLYFGLFEAPYILPNLAGYYQAFVTVGVGFFVVQTAFGIWGTLALFRSYGALAANLRGHA